MPDFGHRLEFASFPEPKSTPPTHALDLAVQSERWGYDLVAIQDHPYQAEYLDTIALISWIAAKTDRIRVVSNVLNMALRSPVIVAKTAATLDLLSDGRFELGLGAGFFWDAIESVGGRRLGPAEATTALEEAVDIVRGAWTTDDETLLDYRGETHSVAGMQRGPSPGHPLPIWIGALKPRMLGLVGRKADGWTASLGTNQSRSEWQAASRLIDEAAIEVGRAPAEIRRMAAIVGTFGSSSSFLEGPTSQWIDQLLPSVIEDGVGTFLLATDDRPTLERFAAEVIPGLRLAVDHERRRTGTK
jgi:alkanesulfonate monooxygenase SsuD/methylene tetrahydromethanopterin reductase-like flavin-dependent oxidoreductase (luciferase family)